MEDDDALFHAWWSGLTTKMFPQLAKNHCVKLIIMNIFLEPRAWAKLWPLGSPPTWLLTRKLNPLTWWRGENISFEIRYFMMSLSNHWDVFCEESISILWDETVMIGYIFYQIEIDPLVCIDIVVMIKMYDFNFLCIMAKTYHSYIKSFIAHIIFTFYIILMNFD